MKFLFVVDKGVSIHAGLLEALKKDFEVSVLVWSPTAKEDLVYFRHKWVRVAKETWALIKLTICLQTYKEYDLIVNLARKRHLAYLVWIRVLKALGIQRTLYLGGFYVQSWAQMRLSRRLWRWVFTENVAAMLQSPSEVRFLQQVGARADFRWAPYGILPELVRVSSSEITLGDYIFAGGHSNRDFDIVLACAEQLSNIPFLIVCSKMTRLVRTVPPNVRIERDVPPNEFNRLLAGSRINVVPLKDETWLSGQSVVLLGMLLGKFTVYADYQCVSCFFEEEGLGVAYRPGDADSLRNIIEEVYYNKHDLSSNGARARDFFFKRFTRDKYDEAIVSHIRAISGALSKIRRFEVER